MKIKIQSSDLKNICMTANKVVPQKSNLPIITNMLFKLSGDNITVVATDMENTIHVTTKLLEDSKIQAELCLPAKILIDILKEMPSQPIFIEKIGNIATIISEQGKYSIPIANADEFPNDSTAEDTHLFNVDSKVINNAMSKLYVCVSDDELRPVLCGVHVNHDCNMGLEFAATDTLKLSVIKEGITPNSDCHMDGNFTIPRKTVAVIKDIFKSGDIEVLKSGNFGVFSTEDLVLRFRLIEGRYPNYNGVIPKNQTIFVEINKSELTQALRRVSVFSNTASRLVKLDFKGNTLELTSEDVDFKISANESLNCSKNGPDIKIGFKCVFLSEILTMIDSEVVTFSMSSKDKAALIFSDKSDKMTTLLMPMLLNE